MEADPFDSLLNLEDKYYDEGYQAGVAQGAREGRIEGRVFGLEKAFDKFVAMGNLHGRAVIWAARMVRETKQKEQSSNHTDGERGDEVAQINDSTDPTFEQKNMEKHQLIQENRQTLPSLPANPRLEKHVRTLYALVEPASLSMQNTEDAVSDFDDRLKRAAAKAKVIEKLVGEGNVDSKLPDTRASGSGPQKGRQVQMTKRERGESSMEDFGGRRPLS